MSWACMSMAKTVVSPFTPSSYRGTSSRKFGFDKESSPKSLICAGHRSREALAELRRPAYDPSEVEADMEYVIAKLGITHDQFKNLMSAPPKTFWDYPSYERDSLLYHLYRGAKSLYLRLRRR